MKEKLRSTINKVLPPLAALLLIFLAWYCICAFGSVPKYMLPSPGDVLAAGVLGTESDLLATCGVAVK